MRRDLWQFESESDKGSGVCVLASRTSISNPPSSNASQLYDSNGNRTADANLPAGEESERSSSNRLLFDGDFYYTYDAEGNRTAKYQLDENDEPVHVNRRYDGTAREPKWAGVELWRHLDTMAEQPVQPIGETCVPISTASMTIRRIAFVSPHCVMDCTNGAATATRDALHALAAMGFDCQAFCGTRLDEPGEGLVQETLSRQGIRYVVQNARIGTSEGRLIFLVDRAVPVTLFENASTRGGWLGAEEVRAFLTACEIFLRKNRPQVVWTYGGDPVSVAVRLLAQRLGMPVLFFLHNFAYHDLASLQAVDCFAAPSEFSRNHYRQSLGLACRRLPYVIDPGRVLVRSARSHHSGPLPEGEGMHVTFVNPQPTKGLFVFARIAEQLCRRRPEIPLLIIEGRGAPGWQQETGIDLARMPNVTIRPNSVDPRTFYADTRLLVAPSLWNESFGLVAAEAMLNGIPVLASNRGALPETIGCPHPDALPVGEGSGGFLFDIPARYTPDTREVPTAEEVAPWVETIIRLWDDAAEYERWSRAARERARQWHPDRLAPIYREFFAGIAR